MIKKLTLAVLATLSTAALADINVGVSVAATGPAASLGIPEKTPSRCCRPPSAARRSITSCSMTPPTRRRPPRTSEADQREKVDVVVGSSTTPEFAGHDGCRRRKRDTADFDGRLGHRRRADGRQAQMGVQDGPERCPHGDRAGPAHDRQERPDRRFSSVSPTLTARAGTRSLPRSPKPAS